MIQAALVVLLAAVFVTFYLGQRRHVIDRRHFVSAMEELIDAYRNGDYELALKKCDGLKGSLAKTHEYCFFRDVTRTRAERGSGG